MSIYAKIETKYADTKPTYPNRNDFTKFHAYGAGKVIGTFNTEKEAKEAGASTTEKVFDEDGFRAANETYRAWSAKVSEEYGRELRKEYSTFNDKTFDILYRMAYEDGHSAGYDEVENIMASLSCDFDEIIAANKE